MDGSIEGTVQGLQADVVETSQAAKPRLIRNKTTDTDMTLLP